MAVIFIVFVERRSAASSQYPKRQLEQFGGESSHLPLKINTSGVIPPIFASSIPLMPVTVISIHGQGPEWLTAVAAISATDSRST